MSYVLKAMPNHHQLPRQPCTTEERFLLFLAISPAVFANIFSTTNNMILSQSKPDLMKSIVEANFSRNRLINRLGTYDSDIFAIVDDFLAQLGKELTTAISRSVLVPSYACELFTLGIAEIMQKLLDYEATAIGKCHQRKPKIPARLQQDIRLLELRKRRIQRRKRRLRSLNQPRTLSAQDCAELIKI